MNFHGLTDDTLRDLHRSAKKAFENDELITSANWVEEAQEFSDRQNPNKPNLLEYFGTAEFPDWQEAVNAMEDEMTRRQMAFVSIGQEI